MVSAVPKEFVVMELEGISQLTTINTHLLKQVDLMLTQTKPCTLYHSPLLKTRRDSRSARYTGGRVNIQAVPVPGDTGESMFEVRGKLPHTCIKSLITILIYGTWSLTGSRSRSGEGGPGGLVLVADGR